MFSNLKHLRDAVRASGGGSGSSERAMTGMSAPVPSRTDCSPFVLVECGLDGLWHVYEEDSDAAEGVFNELHDACDHASNRAGARQGRMVLVREKHGSVVNAYYPVKHGTLSKWFGRVWR